MDKAETIRLEPNPDLDPKGELKSIFVINITHPRSTRESPIQMKFWTFMKNQPWSLKRKMTSMSMEATS